MLGRIVAALVVLVGASLPSDHDSADAGTLDAPVLACAPGQAFPTFTDAQFRDTFNSLDLPGTVPILTPPPITGDAGADRRIQFLAEQRGYRLRADVAVPLGSADGLPLQAQAAAAWELLQQHAARAGHSLVVGSAYRSIPQQRSIVLRALDGYSTAQIRSGAADGAIESMLRTSSIPGYSRHHTGYAIDIGAAGQGFRTFGSSAAFRWLSADNYAAAKAFGFLPSYPPGGAPQGPDPEPWEYVYVGDAIRCPILGDGPGATSRRPGTVDVFVRGQDHGLYHRFSDGSSWSGWHALGGVVTSTPAVASRAPERLDVFVRGQDGALHTRSFDGSAWSGWTNLGGILTSAPAVASRSPGTLDVLAAGADRALYARHFNGTGWSGWTNLGGIITAAPAAASADPGYLSVFARGQDGALWTCYFDGTSWSSWLSLGGIITTAPGVASRAPGTVDVFARGQDNALWTLRYAGGWQPFRSLGGVLASPPAPVAPGGGTLQVFARGQDAALYVTHASGDGFSGWFGLGGVIR